MTIEKVKIEPMKTMTLSMAKLSKGVARKNSILFLLGPTAGNANGGTSLAVQRDFFQRMLSGIGELAFVDQLDDLEEKIARLQGPAVIIAALDAGLRSGLSLFEVIRQQRMPVALIATAENPSRDWVMDLLEAGAVDVMAWPISSIVLRAKVERFFASAASAVADVKPTPFDLERLPELTMKEYKIVRAILSAPAQRITRLGLIERVWPDNNVSPKTIDVHIFNLRRKLRRHGFDIKSGIDTGRSFTITPLTDASGTIK